MSNAFFSAAKKFLGERKDPYLNFNYKVEIGGLEVAGFSEVSGLQVEMEVQQIREGGLNGYIHQLPGPARYPQNLTLKRGLTDSLELWAWYQAALLGKVVRQNISIALMDLQGASVARWNFQGAYPIKWTGPDFRAENGAVAVESIELVHTGMQRVK